MTTIINNNTKQQQPSKWLPRSFIDFHLPTKWIGYQLKGLIKEYYTIIIRKIEFFYQQEKFSEYLLVDIITFLNQLQEKIHKSDYIQLFKQLIIYLRHQLLLKDPIIYYCTIKIIDYCIRFSGYYSQLLMNQSKILLKTISITAIRQSLMNNRRNKRAAHVAFDCIQAWAEAFPVDVIYTEDASIFGTTDRNSSPLLDPEDVFTSESVMGSPVSKRGSPIMMSTPIRSPNQSQRHSNSKTQTLLLLSSPSTSFLSPISSSKKNQKILSPASAASSTSPSKRGRKMTPSSTSSPSSSTKKKKKVRIMKIKQKQNNNNNRKRTNIYRVKSNFALIYNELKQDHHYNQYYLHHHSNNKENNNNNYDNLNNNLNRLEILTMNSIILNTSSFFDADDCSQVMSASQSNLHLTSLNLPPTNNNNIINTNNNITDTSLTNMTLTSPVKGEEIVLEMSSPSSLLSSPLQTTSQSQSLQNLSSSLLTPLNKTNNQLNHHDASLLASLVKNKDRLLIQKQLEQLENVTNVSIQYQNSCERLLLEHHRSLQNISMNDTPGEPTMMNQLSSSSNEKKEIEHFLSDVEDDTLRSPFSAVSTVRTAPLTGSTLASDGVPSMITRPLAVSEAVDIEPMSLTEEEEGKRVVVFEEGEEKREETEEKEYITESEEALTDDLDKVVEALLSGRLAPIQEVKLLQGRQRSNTFDLDDESFEINENENIITNVDYRLTVIPSAFQCHESDDETSMIALDVSSITEDAAPFTMLPIGGRRSVVPFLRTNEERSAFSPISTRLNVSSIFCAFEVETEEVKRNNNEDEDDPELVEILENMNRENNNHDQSMMEALQFLENHHHQQEQHQSPKQTKELGDTTNMTENKKNKERRASFHEEIRQEMIHEILRDQKDQYITTTQQTIYDDENDDSLLQLQSPPSSSSNMKSAKQDIIKKKALSDLTNKTPSNKPMKTINREEGNEKFIAIRKDENEVNTLPFISPQKKSFSEKLQTFEQLASSKNQQLTKHQSWKGGAVVPPVAATDKNVEIKFYGNQRVVVRKNSSYF